MVELVSLHDYIVMMLLRILLLITYLFVFIFLTSNTYKRFSENTVLETVWSILPALLLVFLVLPSIKVLYLIEDTKTPSFTFKIIGHQWYWSYISPFFINFYFKIEDKLLTCGELDSLMSRGTPRLLKTSSSLVVPSQITSRLLITSSDVIHSFSVPGLGLKVDAVPGRLNQIYTIPIKVGVFYGQCSEICGSNHSFIPINVIVRRVRSYKSNSLRSLLGEI